MIIHFEHKKINWTQSVTYRQFLLRGGSKCALFETGNQLFLLYIGPQETKL